jgi:polysaccharide pyruvyl transferase WcaK-like protein
MQRHWKKAASKTLLGASRIVAKSGARRRDPSSALIIPPTSPGSLGDAAMITAAITGLRRHGIARIDLLTASRWPIDRQPDNSVDMEAFLDWRSRVSLARGLPRLARYGHGFFIGADILDGVYHPEPVLTRLAVLKEIAAGGGTATIFGSSFSETPNPAVVAELRALPEGITIAAREPLSHGRMQRLLGRPIKLVADLAFLVEPASTPEVAQQALSWIEGQRAKGKRVIGFNLNAIHDEANPGLVTAAISYLSRLIDAGVAVVLVPHDTRSERSDYFLARSAAAGLSEGQRESVYLLEPSTPSDVKTVMAAADLLVTGRMHPAILAMGAGTPAYCMVYQGKFEGLYRLLGLQDCDLLMDPEAFCANPDDIALRTSQILENGDALRKIISDNLGAVRALAEGNFPDL